MDTCNAVTDIEDSGKKVFCRCWKSKTFPYCDGSHAAVRRTRKPVWQARCRRLTRGSRAQHNKATGDNVGPLIVTKAKAG